MEARTKRSGSALAALAALAWAAAPAPVASAATISGVEIADEVRAGDASLALCSASLLRWKRILDVYVAGLYLGDCGGVARPLDDVPKRLEIAYLRGFKAAQFAESARVILERSFPPEALAPLQDRIDLMHAAYRDVSAQDRYALTYRPGLGTELALNGKPLVRVPGADFAAAYFAIWLGAQPADARLRDELLRPRAR